MTFGTADASVSDRGWLGRGRRWRRDVVIHVELEVLLDGGPELVAGPTELAHGAAQPPPEVWQLVRPEDDQGQDHDDEDLLDADVQHGLGESYTMGRARALAFRPSASIARCSSMRMASRNMWLPDHITPPPNDWSSRGLQSIRSGGAAA